MSRAPAVPVRVVQERVAETGLPLWRHPEWEAEFPWLVQATTGAGAAAEPLDLALFGEQPLAPALERWERVRAALDMPAAVHARQVHGADLLVHDTRPTAGLVLAQAVDGHLTDVPGLLLSVSVADCVPVSVVDPDRRTIALVHAGWRGVAGAIVERALEALATGGSVLARLRVHLGPSICGACYEVGPEVHAGVNPGGPAPSRPTPIDLRAAIARRVGEAGVAPEGITASAHCTRCGPGGFFSHRRGSTHRQMGLLGIRDG